MAIRALLLLSFPLQLNAFVSNETKEFYENVLQNAARPYDRRIRPYAGAKAMDVEIFLRVLSIRSVSELTMDYKVELYFREVWQDPRLAYDPGCYRNVSHISLHESLAEELWMPDTYLPNAIKSRNPDSRSITHRSLLRVVPDGHVLYSRRLSVTAECPMDLSYYPFDSQVCVLSIESYGHAISEVRYKWRKTNPVTLDPHLELPEFKLMAVKTKERNVTLLTGTYTRLECCFFFKRNAGFYFIQLFLPATAIVVTSWFLLYMERTSKFSDMIEVILAITLLYYSYITVMPRVSYIKAMDIYLGSCFVFVFISLIKLYALKLNRWRSPSVARNQTLISAAIGEEDEEEDAEEKLEDYPKKGRNISREAPEKTTRAAARRHVNQKGSKALMDMCNNLDDSRVATGGWSTVLEGGLRNSINVMRGIIRILATSLVVYPLAFVCFSMLYFAYFLVLARDNSQEKCEFPVL